MNYYLENRYINKLPVSPFLKIIICRRAIGLANKLKTTRNKHLSRLFKNLNKFRQEQRLFNQQ